MSKSVIDEMTKAFTSKEITISNEETQALLDGAVGDSTKMIQYLESQKAESDRRFNESIAAAKRSNELALKSLDLAKKSLDQSQAATDQAKKSVLLARISIGLAVALFVLEKLLR